MTIRKAKGMEANFSIVPNDTINDGLSWAAKGLLVYLCSKPDDWEVSVAQLVKHSMDSSKPTKRDATYTIINELIAKGYIVRNQENKSGRFGKAEYIVTNVPQLDLPDTDEPHTDLPDTVKPTQQSKVLNKEQIVNKDLCAKDDFAFDFFWESWHNKKNRKGAVKSFDKVFKQRCKELKIEPTAENKYKFANKLSLDVQRRLETGQIGFDKIHATTYLNNERWNDDYEATNRNQPQASTASGVSSTAAAIAAARQQRDAAQGGSPMGFDGRDVCGQVDSEEWSGRIIDVD